MTSQIILENQRIIDFYQENPSIDPISVNIALIDLIEPIIQNKKNSSDDIGGIILSKLSAFDKNLLYLKQNVEHVNSNTAHTAENIDVLKTDLMHNVSSNIKDCNTIQNATFETTLCSLTRQMSENINACIQAVIPDSSSKTTQDITNALELYQKQTLCNIKDVLTTYLTANNLQVPVLNCISSSEKRIMDAVDKIANNSSIAQQTSAKLSDDLHDICNRFKNSSNKGKLGETHLENILNIGFPTAEIANTSGERASCDFKIMRSNLPTILIETKEYTRNVNKDEVIKFIRDIKECKTHGVFLSQHSGIANKQNFEMNIIDKYIVIYIHNVEYSIDYIRMAIRAIDELHPYICKNVSNTSNDDDIHIKKTEFEQIINDYTSFAQKKVSMIENYKTFMKTVIKDTENLEIPSLKYILQTRSGINTTPEKTVVEKEQFICNYCNRKFGTSRGKQIHENKCTHKTPAVKTNEIDSAQEENMITQL